MFTDEDPNNSFFSLERRAAIFAYIDNNDIDIYNLYIHNNSNNLLWQYVLTEKIDKTSIDDGSSEDDNKTNVESENESIYSISDDEESSKQKKRRYKYIKKHNIIDKIDIPISLLDFEYIMKYLYSC